MSVETSSEAFLVEIMGNKTDASAEDEKAVEDTHLHVFFGLLGAEGTTVAHEVHETDCYSAVDVENQIVLLGGGDGFDGDGVIEHFAAGEVLLDKLFDELDAEIRVVAGLNFMTNTRN